MVGRKGPQCVFRHGATSSTATSGLCMTNECHPGPQNADASLSQIVRSEVIGCVIGWPKVNHKHLGRGACVCQHTVHFQMTLFANNGETASCACSLPSDMSAH